MQGLGIAKNAAVHDHGRHAAVGSTDSQHVFYGIAQVRDIPGFQDWDVTPGQPAPDIYRRLVESQVLNNESKRGFFRQWT